VATECAPDELAEGVKCLQNQDQQTLLAQILYQLCILNGMACDPDTLSDIDEVKCLQNWDIQSLLAVIAYELCQINAGGGGGNLIQVYEGRDPLPPNDPTKAALNYPTGGGIVTNWVVGTQSWV